MKFGITLKPDHRFDRSIDLARRAEANGFGYGWIFDSHILWRDPYPLLTLMGTATERMRLGTCVTNPATRDVTVTASALATLNEITGGRMDLGIGLQKRAVVQSSCRSASTGLLEHRGRQVDAERRA